MRPGGAGRQSLLVTAIISKLSAKAIANL